MDKFTALIFLPALLGTLASGEIFFKSGAPHVKLQKNAGLAGETLFSRNGRPYSAFKGIPYAKIPERFAASELIRELGFEGYRNVTDNGQTCAQAGFGGQNVGVEDCLNLNVFVPMSTEKRMEDYPVMFYVHGGGFGSGSVERTTPSYFMDEDVIVVLITYRVGVLGFLSTGDHVVPGNNGLKDQVIALKWVKENIAKFGGNPNSVTIFGLSAGGASTHYLLLSDTTKGLFHNVISQAGDVIGMWAHEPNPRRNAAGLANFLKCPTNADNPADISSQEIAACLKKAPLDQLMTAQSIFTESIPPGLGHIFNFVPVIEPESSGSSANPPFLTESPVTLFENQNYPMKEIPWMIGVTKDEGFGLVGGQILQNEQLLKELNNNWDRVAPKAFYFDRFLPLEDQHDVASKMKEFYFQNQRVSYDLRMKLYDAYSDAWGLYGARKAALIVASRGVKNPVYLYQYSYLAEKSLIGFFMGAPNPDKLVTHGDDAITQFELEGMAPEGFITGDIKLNGPDTDFSRHFIRLWASFATHGKPTYSWGTAHEKEWLPISAEEASGRVSLKWYNIDINPGFINEPFTERMKFWDGLWKDHFVPAVEKFKSAQKAKTEL